MTADFWLKLRDDAMARGMDDLASHYLQAALRHGEFWAKADHVQRLSRELKELGEKGEIAFGKLKSSIPKFKSGGIVKG